jgi:hypothetical protein
MSNSVILIDSPPVKIKPDGSSKLKKLKLKNGLDENIYDLWIDTNHTWGNDPDIRKITVFKDGKKVKILSDPPDGEDSVRKHVVFINDSWAPGEVITVKIDFDAAFEDDEYITFSPTDIQNYEIMGNHVEVCHTPVQQYAERKLLSMHAVISSLQRNALSSNELQMLVALLLENISFKDLLEMISKIEGIDIDVEARRGYVSPTIPKKSI